MQPAQYQQTIVSPATVRGFGYWSGKDIRVEFRPAAAGTGIVFVRDDLAPPARIAARVENRVEVPRRSNLQVGRAGVEMVEHVMAVLAGLGIDNCEVGVDAVEMPGCDGSAIAFVDALDAVGIVQQELEVQPLEVTETIRCELGETWIEARPTAGKGLSVEFQLDYPHDSVIGRQTVSLDITPETFRTEIAPCRTFVLQSEAEALQSQGRGTRVTNRDLLIFGPQGPIDNPLRFVDECARHKVLDVVGDMALTGQQIIGHVVAHRSGHRLNAELAAELVRRFGNESNPTGSFVFSSSSQRNLAKTGS